MKLLLQTQSFMDECVKEEIKTLLNKKVEQIGEGLHECNISSDELYNVVENIIEYSRTLERVYLIIDKRKKVDNFDISPQQLDVIHTETTFRVISRDEKISEQVSQALIARQPLLSVDKEFPDISFTLFSNEEYILALDLANFNLTKRDYVQHNSYQISPLYYNYLFTLSQFKEKDSIIDPLAQYGNLIIEAALFLPRVPLHIKDIRKTPLYRIISKINMPPSIPKREAKIIGVVQDNNSFKKVREHLQFIGLKIKLSQYELDWLDVKFKEKELDYVITHLPPNSSKEFLEEFFYQAEFIVKRKIGIITQAHIDEKILKKFKLVISIKKELKEFNIYIIERK